MPDTAKANQDGHETDQAGAHVAPRESDANTPQPQDRAKSNHERVRQNWERYVVSPLRRTIRVLDNYSGATTAVATVVIMIATIVNVIYVGGQLAEMKNSGIQTNGLLTTNANLAQAAKDQASAAVTQAKATQALAQATRDIQIDSRATITATLQSQPPMIRMVAPGQPASFALIITNNGFAAARDVRAWMKAELREYPLTSPIIVVTPHVGPITLAKDGQYPELDAVTDTPVSQSDYDAIQRGTKTIYIFGEATYIDPYNMPVDDPLRYIYGKGSPGIPPAAIPSDFPVTENKD